MPSKKSPSREKEEVSKPKIRLPSIKASEQEGVPVYGCEHVKLLLTGSRMENFLVNFKDCLRVIGNGTSVPHTSISPSGHPLVTLTTNYLCLQCPHTTTERGRIEHGAEKKHRFYVESRSGCVFCQMCNDFIQDPTLEELRLRKMCTGYSLTPTRKRKHEEMFAVPHKEDQSKGATLGLAEVACGTGGIRGIYNMGATCYMNVILQSIVHNPLMRNYYLSDMHPRAPVCTIKNCMSCAMDDMFQEFYQNEVTTGYAAAGILESFWLSKRKAYEELATNKEQDAHEFFIFLLEELHEIANGEKLMQSSDDEPSPKRLKSSESCKCIIHQTFYGKLQSTITCQNCKASNSSFQEFMDVSLAIDFLSKKQIMKGQKLNLQRRLDEEFTKDEACDYKCDCGSNKAMKVNSIKSLPNALCIQLKRFKQNADGTQSKVDTDVTFPLKLDMFPYTSKAMAFGNNRQQPELTRSCTYELQSVVVHKGNLDTGHYVSYSRTGGQWFRFNDHMVKQATKSEVLSEQAFLLFYVIQSLA